jgi:hypothetical protein
MLTNTTTMTTMNTTTDDQSERRAMLAALDTWIRQRPGLEWGNYGGDGSAYRAELRDIARDRRDALALLRAVETCGRIDAAMLREAFRAFSGRLSLVDKSAHYNDGSTYYKFGLSYVTGQYWPTEYRKAAAAVLAAAWWDGLRETMPPESAYQVQTFIAWASDGRMIPRTSSRPYATREAADAALVSMGGLSVGYVLGLHDGQTPGDWLRHQCRRAFGRGLASRWFS